MSNQQPGQGQQGQPNQQRKVMLFKPEQMRILPEQFTAEEKQKWEQGLRALWTQINNNDADSQPHQDAKRKLFEFSRTLQAKLQAGQQQKAQQSLGGGNGGGPRPQSQGQPQTQGGDMMNRAKPQVSKQLMEHVSKFPYRLPPTLTAGTAEAHAWITNAKNQFLKALVSMEGGSTKVNQLKLQKEARENSGNPLNEQEMKDWALQMERAENQNKVAKKFVDDFRREQQSYQNPGQAGNQAGSMGNANSAGAAQVARPQLNPQQQALNPTQTVNAAIEAARNQQMGAGRPNMPGQMPSGQQNVQMGQGNQQNSNIKMEGGQIPAPINTQISQMQQRSFSQNSPQSAVPRSAGGPAPPSATTTQSAAAIPQSFSLTEATNTAARTYSSSAVAAPNVMGHSHPSATARDTMPTNNNKMPIPKSLPESASRPPQAVAMPTARPSYSGGPSNLGNGVIGQPAIQKTPGYSMDHDGERVLSKKKLDELVRQVTGGGGDGEGMNLMADVEDSILTVADNFVDQVLEAACKNAKERGSRVLEIRDIQLTLERGYNIRIPGYSSDEIRTVRKIQPDPKWISKMSAVQAAKVTGGKGGD